MEKKLMKGNEAFAAAAISAGCRYYFGYPITPQNEVPEYMSRELRNVGGHFIQAESELASISFIYGAAAAGARCMTSSSSIGIALMQEGLGSCVVCELPCVIINVMRAGPGIGAIQPAQADYTQVVKSGMNGDAHCIVYAPTSIQEAVNMIYHAFDVADEYRNPVIICVDGMIGQMMEPVIIPESRAVIEEKDIEKTKPWALCGHRNRRDRNKINSVFLNQYELEDRIMNRLLPKFEKAKKELPEWESRNLEGAEAVFVAYGSTARIAIEAMELLEKEGIKVGIIRPKTLWPFPDAAFDEIDSKTTKVVISVELSLGQMLEDIRLALEGRYPTALINRVGGILLSPVEVAERTKAVLGGMK